MLGPVAVARTLELDEAFELVKLEGEVMSGAVGYFGSAVSGLLVLDAHGPSGGKATGVRNRVLIPPASASPPCCKADLSSTSVGGPRNTMRGRFWIPGAGFIRTAMIACLALCLSSRLACLLFVAVDLSALSDRFNLFKW
jgi:hypothetical protein